MADLKGLMGWMIFVSTEVSPGHVLLLRPFLYLLLFLVLVLLQLQLLPLLWLLSKAVEKMLAAECFSVHHRWCQPLKETPRQGLSSLCTQARTSAVSSCSSPELRLDPSLFHA